MGKKLLSYVLSFSLLVGIVFAVPSIQAMAQTQEGPEVTAEGYCVVDNLTGEIVFSKNKDERYYPASITKIMTALVVAEQCDNWYEKLTYDQETIASLEGTRSSTLTPAALVGEKMTVKDALYGMILCSGNDCAAALARYIAGSEEEFAKLMNQKAEEVGAVNTHFVTPHGLHDENHYTTPYDMYLITKAAMDNPISARILETINYTVKATNLSEARAICMSHQMVNKSIDNMGAYAGKTGRTPQAGRTLVTLARGDNYDLTVIILKSTDASFYVDTQILLDYAIEAVNGKVFEKTVLDTEEPVWAVGDVALRTYASSRSDALGYIPKNMQVMRVGSYGDWSIVNTKSGKTAYVLSSYLTTEQPQDWVPQTDESGTDESSTKESTVSEESESAADSTKRASQESTTSENTTTDKESTDESMVEESN